MYTLWTRGHVGTMQVLTDANKSLGGFGARKVWHLSWASAANRVVTFRDLKTVRQFVSELQQGEYFARPVRKKGQSQQFYKVNPCGSQSNPRESIDIYVERTRNGVVLSAMHEGHRVRKLYQGYSVKDAKADFMKVLTKKNPCGGSKRRNPIYEDDSEVMEIEDDDYVIQDSGYLGSQYKVNRLSGSFTTFQGAIKAIVAAMNKEQYWPGVYYVNDHGNVDQIAIRIGKRGITYKTVG